MRSPCAGSRSSLFLVVTGYGGPAMGLLQTLGLGATARMRGVAAGTPLDGAPQRSGLPSAIGAPPSTSTPVVATSADEVVIGPAAEGPEFDRLYALMSPDGKTPLDRSNSKGGARDNEVALEVARGFARVKALELAWYAQYQAVQQQAAASAKELEKMKAAEKAFTARSDVHDDVSGESGEYVKAIRAVKEQVDAIDPMIDEADAAMDDVDVALASKEVHRDEEDRDKAKGALEDAKEEAKERQEMFKGALGVLGKIASPAEWTEIAVEGLVFVDEQLFAQLPKQKIEALKKRVEEATDRLAKHQGAMDASAIHSAQKKLSAANKRLQNARNLLQDRVKDLALSQRRVVKKLAASPATADVARMIASSRKMQTLMSQAKNGGQAYLAESRALLKDCRHATDLFFGFPSAVKMTPGVDPVHARLLTATAKRNEATLKSWSAYLESLQAEVEEAVRACGDMSDKGFMKNYNQIEPVMQKMLSI